MTEDTLFELNYNVSRNDYRRFLWYHNLVKNGHRRLIFLVIYTVFILSLPVILKREPSLILIIFLLCFYFYYVIVYYLHPYYFVSKLKDDSQFLGNKSIKFKENSYFYTDNHGSGEVNYSVFQSIRESKNYIYLYMELNVPFRFQRPLSNPLLIKNNSWILLKVKSKINFNRT